MRVAFFFCKQTQCIFDFISFSRCNFCFVHLALPSGFAGCTTIHTFDSFVFKYLSFSFGLSRELARARAFVCVRVFVFACVSR